MKMTFTYPIKLTTSALANMAELINFPTLPTLMHPLQSQ
jgi:hypothetical protein